MITPAAGTRRFFSFNNKVFIFIFVILILSTVAISFVVLRYSEKVFPPEIDRKAVAVASSINATFSQLLDYGVPFNRLTGVSNYFDTVIRDNREIKYIFVTVSGGAAVQYASGIPMTNAAAIAQKTSTPKNAQDTVTPVTHRGATLGELHIGIDTMIARTMMMDIIYDIIVVIVVSLLLAFELVLFLVTFFISGPIETISKSLSRAGAGDFSEGTAYQSNDEIGAFAAVYNNALRRINETYHRVREAAAKAGAAAKGLLAGIEQNHKFTESTAAAPAMQQPLSYIRPPLFLLIFAESLSLSFFPFYVKELYAPVPGISPNLVIGLPISLFMLVWAFSLPYAGAWSEKVGRRIPLIAGALITAVGLIITSFAFTLYDLLLWRCVTAVGYGIVYITCQGYITDNTTSQNRTRGMAMFLAGFFSGSLCGSAIGGILADRIGYRPTFLISALFSVVSALFVMYFLREPKRPAAAVAKKRMSFSDIKMLFGNRRFVAITLLSSIPAKICLTGFLYFAAPLFLKQLGNSQSAIGRVLMSYGLMMIFLSPLVGNLADRFGKRRLFTNIGGISAGIGLLLILLFRDSTVGVLMSIAILGIAHSIQVSSQMSLITEDCAVEGKQIGLATVVGIYRLIERIGNIAGPIVAGLLIAFFGAAYGEERGYPYAIAAIGGLTVLASVAFIFFYAITGPKKTAEAVS